MAAVASSSSSSISRCSFTSFSPFFGRLLSGGRRGFSFVTPIPSSRLLSNSPKPTLPVAADINKRKTPTPISLVSSPLLLLLQHQWHNRFFSYGSNIRTTKNPIVYSSDKSSSDDDDDDEEEEEAKKKKKVATVDKSKLPPPYDPFNKKPVVEEPKDPTDLQEIFHKMRTEGLLNNAIKMFDALSKDGLTHEAMQLFSQIKDKGHMPDVVAHTAVIEAYVNAGNKSKDALKVFMRMLASGVQPNAYTYTVLIKGLSRDGRLLDATKYLLEMMDKGIRPNAATYTAVFEAFAAKQEDDKQLDEAKKLFDKMKSKGFVPDEKAVKDNLSNKRGHVYRTVMNLLFSK